MNPSAVRLGVILPASATISEDRPASLYHLIDPVPVAETDLPLREPFKHTEFPAPKPTPVSAGEDVAHDPTVAKMLPNPAFDILPSLAPATRTMSTFGFPVLLVLTFNPEIVNTSNLLVLASE